METEKSPFAEHATNVIDIYVKTKNTGNLQQAEVPELFKIERACFVTIHNKDGSLRGCIGTIEPRTENLWLEIISNAVSACSRDPRFNPVTKDELNKIEVSVDVLSVPERVDDIKTLDPKKYGIIISDGKHNRGVLLPDIDGVDTVKEQIRIAKRKAGLHKTKNEFLEIYSFTATRYH
jgi:AmmeMemoRadiSam system protein A